MKQLVMVVTLAVAVTWTSRMTMSDEHGWEPLSAITDLVAWFRDLNDRFDAAVEQEKRAQLRRAVDELRKSLYELELDTQHLIDSIPDVRPTELERSEIRENVRKLLSTVSELGQDLRRLGADLRLEDSNTGYEIERRLTYGLRTRALVLTETQKALNDSANPETRWQPELIKNRLTAGLNAIQDAQLAANEFQRSLGPVREGN